MRINIVCKATLLENETVAGSLAHQLVDHIFLEPGHVRWPDGRDPCLHRSADAGSGVQKSGLCIGLHGGQ